ncbi:MAG: hypothetical protein HQL95_01835 [Magnetococcales bacterium]|nr:hypothetical protein [Magnetococcales bacterium]
MSELDAGRQVDFLWLCMTDWYGHLWTDHHDEQDNGTWLRDLSDLSPAQIHRGLAAVRDEGEKYPPSLPHFRKLCLGDDAENGYYPPEIAAIREEATREYLADRAAMLTREIGHG